MDRRFSTTVLCVLLAGAMFTPNGLCAEAPMIAIQPNGDRVTLTFRGTLQESSDAVHWETINAVSPYEVTITGGNRFYRATGDDNSTWTANCGDGVVLELLRCPAGSFSMGSPEDELGHQGDETLHEVRLTTGFWMGKYPVTQEQYEAVMGRNPSEFSGRDCPVETVTWDEAVEFCNVLTATERAAGNLPAGYVYSLPTEAQWEYACRAGTTTAFNNGTDIPSEEQLLDDPCFNLGELGWYRHNSGEETWYYARTWPVGEKKPNAWGMYDMHGNVWEWCLDWYDSRYYSDSPVADPEGPAVGEYRVCRGGGWESDAQSCRSAFRKAGKVGYHAVSLGFRVALVFEKKRVVACSDEVSMEMIGCPAGTFAMGSPSEELGRDESEEQCKVTLTRPFWIGEYEVTQEQYESVVGKNPSHFKGANLPVECVSWSDAMKFCRKLNARERSAGRLPAGYVYSLPTEAQWEYACRAGTTTALNNGKDLTDTAVCPNLDEVAWYDVNSNSQPHPVGQKAPNAWGLYDMHGNVMEWCSGWVVGHHGRGPHVDPTGPASGTKRAWRGGSWNTDASYCRSGACWGGGPYESYRNVGFRLALVPER